MELIPVEIANQRGFFSSVVEDRAVFREYAALQRVWDDQTVGIFVRPIRSDGGA